MKRRRVIYEGKAKILYEGTEPGTVIQYFKDDATAGNGAKKPVRMGKSICQRAIPPEQALKIFRDGKSDLLPRFISKKGKPFSAYLKLDGAKVTFEFEPRQKKAAAAKKAPAAAEAEG